MLKEVVPPGGVLGSYPVLFLLPASWQHGVSCFSLPHPLHHDRLTSPQFRALVALAEDLATVPSHLGGRR